MFNFYIDEVKLQSLQKNYCIIHFLMYQNCCSKKYLVEKIDNFHLENNTFS